MVGLNDLSARKILRKLGKDLVTVALPFALYREMEANVAGSFLERDPWTSLTESASRGRGSSSATRHERVGGQRT